MATSVPETDRRRAVLVIEDEPLLRLMAVDMVEDAGFEAVVAAGADRAIDILETRPDIRVVFTDIDMYHGMDGLRLAAIIRDRWPPVEFIVVSGLGRPEVSAMPARSVFFAKPYREAEVTAAMHRLSSGT